MKTKSLTSESAISLDPKIKNWQPTASNIKECSDNPMDAPAVVENEHVSSFSFNNKSYRRYGPYERLKSEVKVTTLGTQSTPKKMAGSRSRSRGVAGDFGDSIVSNIDGKKR